MSYSEAIAEAYASSPDDEIQLDTLELIHPAFLDDFGNKISVRVVEGFDDYMLRLESNAPLQPNQMVLFRACPFRFKPPEVAENEAPSLQLSLTNVSREITKYLEMAAQQTSPITVIYRPYLASDPEGPQMLPVLTMTLTKVKSDVFQTTGAATLSDVHNWPFPNYKYLPELFPGLVR